MFTFIYSLLYKNVHVSRCPNSPYNDVKSTPGLRNLHLTTNLLTGNTSAVGGNFNIYSVRGFEFERFSIVTYL